MTDFQIYDAIVIGSGQAGGPLATALANDGRKTALIEQSHVGGTCVNEGCTPTKTMVASARVAYLARRASEYGVQTGPPQVDMKVVRQRKRDIVESFRAGSEARLKSTANLDLLMGQAHFTGHKELQVEMNDGASLRLKAESIFINTGCRPAPLEIQGVDNVNVLDSTSIMELDVVPEHLVVIGGGYVGLEFAQMFRRFGSNVTIIQRGKQLLGREDHDVADVLTTILKEDGIDILIDSSAQSVAQDASGRLRLEVRTDKSEKTVVASHLLAAAGRIPNTASLHLSTTNVDVATPSGFVSVNEGLETSAPGIYALGDVKGGPQFTHISYDDYRVLKTNLIDHGSASTRSRLVPYTVFTDPQLGRIGLTEAAAAAQNRRVRVARMPMSYVARAVEMDESRGFIKALVDAETEQIVGAAVLGVDGGEVMAMLQIAMAGKVKYTALRDGVFAHPTLAEALNNLFAGL